MIVSLPPNSLRKRRPVGGRADDYILFYIFPWCLKLEILVYMGFVVNLFPSVLIRPGECQLRSESFAAIIYVGTEYCPLVYLLFEVAPLLQRLT
jgi:hypothetical protein